jgi:hypothetical protein
VSRTRGVIVDAEDGLVLVKVGRLLRPTVVLELRPVEVDVLCNLLKNTADYAQQVAAEAAKHRERVELAAAKAGT